MNTAIILHTVEDANHCIKNRLNQNNMFFSTNYCVDIYLKEYFKVDCKCLSSFLTADDIKKFKEQTSRAVDQILQELDSKIAPELNSQFNLKMKYFTPLYSYLGKHQFLAYLCFLKTIQKVKEVFEIKKFLFYNYKFNDFFSISSNISDVITLLNKETNFEVIKYKHKKIIRLNILTMELLEKIRKKIFEPKTIIHFLTKKLKNRKFRIISNKKTILLYEPLFELKFLKEKLANYNLIYYRYNDLYPFGFSNTNLEKNGKIELKSLDFEKRFDNQINNLFFNNVREDFLNNISQYMNGIKFIDKINNSNQISLGIWDYGPIENIRSLVFEYLKSKKISVLGAQHGSLFGDSYGPWQFDAEFNRCDSFISYGFTNNDLERMYPDTKIDVKILPFGKKEPTKNKKAKKSIDILFPITKSFSIFNAGLSRVLPHILLKRHIEIFEYLDLLKGLDIYIKPFPFPNYNDCSVLHVLKRLRNIKVVANMTLNEFLSKYNPRIVILDFPTTPLYETLHLDAEIFLMNDDVAPFEKECLTELQKRVHYFEDVAELINALNLFFAGKLEKKRDNSFLNHYVYKSDSEKNILSFINQITQN